MNKIVKNSLVGILIFVVAFAGVYFGMLAKGVVKSPAVDMSDQPVTTGTKMVLGSPFPDVEVLDQNSTSLRSSSLVKQKGAVVLFMEIGCAPCVTMSHKWQQLIHDGVLANDEVMGITFVGPDLAKSYALKEGLTFPIYCDTALVFVNQYAVTEYPLCMTIGKSGKIRAATYDPRQEVTSDGIHKVLAN